MTLIYGVTSDVAEEAGPTDLEPVSGPPAASADRPATRRLASAPPPQATRAWRATARVGEPSCHRTLRLDQTVSVPGYFEWKAYFDRMIALLLLIPGLPMIAVLGLLVRLTSPGPALFRQLRVGKDGTQFQLLKLRTMRNDAEVKTGPVWSVAGDPRVTPVGHWLRKLHLDELPQIFNVLRGEMALVGPRPERPEFVAVLDPIVPGYAHRVAVAPGVTGLAQLNLEPDSDLCSVCRKTVLDLDYIKQANPWMDLRILLCTGLRMFKLASFPLLRLFRVSRRVLIEGCPNGCTHPSEPVTPLETVENRMESTVESTVENTVESRVGKATDGAPTASMQETRGADDTFDADDTLDDEPSPRAFPNTLEPCCEPIRRLVQANGRASILFQRLVADADSKPRKPR